MRLRIAVIVSGLVCHAGLVANPTTNAAASEEVFDYFSNNWNVIGLKDYVHGSRVTPDNEVLLSGKIPVQVRFGSKLTPLSRAHSKLAMHGWMPIMLVVATDGPIRYEITLWATPLPDVRDFKRAFDWPTEGENFLCWIRVKATNTSDTTSEAKVEVGPTPNEKLPEGFAEQQAEPASEGRHTRTHSWSWSLGAGQSALKTARYPFFPVEDPEIYDREDAEVWLQRTQDFWRTMVTERTTHIEVPCRKATEALMASHVCQLIANDHGELRGGENFYDRFYPRDGAYQVMELEEAGLFEAARQA
ncbi:MAG: hypothetical protein ACYSW0_25075, partial [Planctomycetota bacterium]